MHWMHTSLRLSCSLILLSGLGCYSYTPYGAGGYPGGYPVPPGGTAPYQGGTRLGPPSSLPSQSQAVPEYDSQAQTFDDGSQGGRSFDSQNGQSNAPLYEPQRNGSDGAGGTKPVPEYEDPNSTRSFSSGKGRAGDGGASEQPDGQNADGQQDTNSGDSNSVDSQFDQEGARSPFNTPGDAGARLKGAQQFPAQASFGPDEEPDTFKPPVKAQPAAATRTLVQTSASTESQNADPYAYDSQGYRWLRGVAHYDEQDDSWQLIYSLNPSAEDEFGGSITLADHPQLRGLPDRSVVLVEGRVDRQQRDTFGKPQYRVERLARLTPRQQ